MDLGQYMKMILDSWLIQGRFYPISPAFTIIYWLFSYPVYLLKSVYVLGTILSSLTFFLFVRRLSNSFWFALFSLIFIPLVLQYHSYHDPLTAYHLLMQSTFMLLIISMLLFFNYLQSEKRSILLLSLSVLLYLSFLLTYEISIVFILFYLLIAFYFEKRITPTIRTVWPFLLCVSIMLGVTFYLRAHATISPEAYQVNFSFLISIKTWLNQVSSTIPFSYALFNDQEAFRNILSMFTWADFIFFYIFVISFHYIFNRLDHVEHKWLLFFVSILLIVLPGVLLTLSPKYQDEIKAGNGYLPVFFQYYGGISLAAMCLIYLKQKFNRFRWWKYGYSVVLFLISAAFIINLKLNIYSIEKQNEAWYYPRSILEQSLQAGIFDNIPPNALIVYQDPYNAYFTKEGLYYQFTNKIYSQEDLVDYMAKYFNENQISNSDVFNRRISDEVYMIDFHAMNNSQGYVLVGKVTGVSGTRLKYDVMLDTARLFLDNSNKRFSLFQNLILENPLVQPNYLTEIRFEDNEILPLKVTEGKNIELEPMTSAIQITALQPGKAFIYNIHRKDNQPFIIKKLELTSQKSETR